MISAALPPGAQNYIQQYLQAANLCLAWRMFIYFSYLVISQSLLCFIVSFCIDHE
jgi:hypothetical protein